MSTIARLSATTVVAIAALTGSSGAAFAGSQSSVDVPHSVELFYGNSDIDVLAFAGRSVAEHCDPDGAATTVAARLTERSDGTVTIRARAHGVPLYLYSTTLGAPEFIAEQCALSEPAEPFATGVASTRERLDIDGDTVKVVNRMHGKAWSPSGDRYRVDAWADLVVEAGVPQGSPDDFQGLRLR